MAVGSPSEPGSHGVLACVFDWAGTTIDFGSLAPAQVFREAFAAHGVDVTEAQAREPMGRPKRDHIRAMGAMPAIAGQWRARHGGAFDEAAVETIYAAFLPRQIEVARERADVIPGVVETVERLRSRGIRIGSTTGYSRDIMAGCTARAAEQGFRPDVVVCADDCAQGRPAPHMLWRAMMELEAWPPHRVVKVGDTDADIAEGLNGGTWTVACVVTGSAMGLSAADVAALAPKEFSDRRDRAADTFRRAGAHYVVNGVADLMPAIDAIESRLAMGERPG